MNDLIHYSSAYYDPAEAHEYYLKNRELKGQRSTGGMSDQQKEVWKVSKSNIANAKKQEVTAAQESRRQKIEALQERATQMREKIAEKLSKLSEKINGRAIAEGMRLEKQIQAKMNSLPPIPANANPAQRAILLEKRQKEVAQIQGSAESKRESIGKGKAESRESLNQKREKVKVELKSKVAEARDAYTAAKKSIDEKYETAYQQEYDNIRSKMPGKPKPKTKKRSTTNEDSKV